VAADALGTLAIAAAIASEFDQARTRFEELVAHFRAVGPPARLARHLINLGNVAGSQGDYARAQACYEEGLALERADYGRAHQLLAESLVVHRELGERWNVATTLSHLAVLSVREAIGSNVSAAVQAALAQDVPVLRDSLGAGPRPG
jgi:hypothetical protein